MDFDDILQYIGDFGTYQKRVYLLLCILTIFHGMRMVVMVFILFVPKHRCLIPGYLNDTYEVTTAEHLEAVEKSIPPGSSCYVYQLDNYTRSGGATSASLVKCNYWVYDQSMMFSTVASQFNLVCDEALKASHETMIYYGGFLVSTFVIGTVSDRIGRKLCLYWSLTVAVVAGTLLAFTQSFLTFTVLNFIVGAATAGIFPTAYVMGIELVGPSKRSLTGIVIQLFFSTGVVLLAGLAYLTRDWRHLVLAITLPLIIYYFFWSFIPESIRWQIQKGYFRDARQTVLAVARINKREVPVSVLDAVVPGGVDTQGHREKVNKVKGGSFFELFRFAISLSFYGLNYNSGNLGVGSIFLNFSLAGLVEFPAYIYTLCTINRLGRRLVHFSMMATGGVACLSCVVSINYAPQDYQWLTVVLAMIGKLGSAGAYSTVYVHSTEIFPTVIRHSAFGASASWARIGAMLSPYIAAMGANDSGVFGHGLPLLICGCVMLSAGTLALLLPETLNRKLPETINDARHFTRSAYMTGDIKIVTGIPVGTGVEVGTGSDHDERTGTGNDVKTGNDIKTGNDVKMETKT